MQDHLNPSIVSDLHKDAYGFRPCQVFWTEWQALDEDGKLELWDNMIDMMNSDIGE